MKSLLSDSVMIGFAALSFKVSRLCMKWSGISLQCITELEWCAMWYPSLKVHMLNGALVMLTVSP